MNRVSEELVARASRGDQEAMSAILIAIRPWAYRFAHARLQDPDCAEDVAQSILLSVFLRIDRFRAESRFSTWVQQIAANAVNTHFRAEKASRNLLTKVHVFSLSSEAGREPEVVLAEEIDSRRLDVLVKRTVENLPPFQRTVLRLVGFGGLQPWEAAEALEKTQANLRSGLSRARKKVRDRLVESRWKDSLSILEASKR